MKKSGTENTQDNTCQYRIFQKSRGAALITIIIAIVVISAIGAAILSLSAVGTFNPILGNSADRAYYLAESGYRYAALKFQQGGESMLDDLNSEKTFEVDNNQKFSLEFRPHKLEVTGGSDSDTLNTAVPFGYAPHFETGNITGHLKIGDTPAQEFSSVTIPDEEEGVSVNFERAGSEEWNASTGDQARFSIVFNNESSVSEEGGDLQVQSDTGTIEFFPKYNGRFAAEGKIYQYRSRDAEYSQLLGITRVDDDWEELSLEDGDEIILNDFLTVISTGRYGQGFFGANRRLTYYIPFLMTAAGSDFLDTFDNMNHWIEDDGDTAEGGYRIDDDVDGDSALAVDGTTPKFLPDPLTRTSLIEFDWDPERNVDLEDAWSSDGGCLSYDAQVKILVDDEPVYMDGISFRLDEEGSYYGLSLLYTDDSTDGIPNGTVPEYGQPMIVLWENDVSGWPSRTWVAYHALPAYNYLTNNVFFRDNMEDRKKTEDQWNTIADEEEDEWTRTSHYFHSGNHSWMSPEGPVSPNTTTTLQSESFDLRDASEPTLTFWHDCEMEGRSRARVEISENGEDWQELARYQNDDTNGWDQEEFDLSDYAGSSDVWIRFNLRTSNNPDQQAYDWYVDDVYVAEEGVDWPTLMVSVKEAESISFDNGSNSINNGDTVYQEDASGVTASAIVYTDPVIAQGTWSGGTAQGDILLRDISGSFQTGEDLLVNGEVCANLTSLNNKQNYIRAYIGDQQEHGTAGTDPLDRQRLANPRGEVNWPPRDVDDTYADNDYFTLVQWDELNYDEHGTTIAQLGDGNEEDAVIRSNSPIVTTPPEDDGFDQTRPELGLHTWGWGSSDGEPEFDVDHPDIYFDDFAVRLDDAVMSGGFAPAIQESSAGD